LDNIYNYTGQVGKNTKDMPCLRKLLSGKCESRDCKYGHSTYVLLKGAEDMSRKANAFTNTHGPLSKVEKEMALMKRKPGVIPPTSWKLKPEQMK